jgi:CHAT domain-containing protein
VLGTLWPVDDVAAALVTSKFYLNHIRNGLDIASALREAQLWLRGLSLEEMDETFEELLGDIPEEQSAELRADVWLRSRLASSDEQRPFSHPYYWAAYTCFGA